ncbi:MAG: hypothetical protein AVDCRST_MAG22-445, partial [uncultured Rubrobacteraceae bacterium]
AVYRDHRRRQEPPQALPAAAPPAGRRIRARPSGRGLLGRRARLRRRQRRVEQDARRALPGREGLLLRTDARDLRGGRAQPRGPWKRHPDLRPRGTQGAAVRMRLLPRSVRALASPADGKDRKGGRPSAEGRRCLRRRGAERDLPASAHQGPLQDDPALRGPRRPVRQRSAGCDRPSPRRASRAQDLARPPLPLPPPRLRSPEVEGPDPGDVRPCPRVRQPGDQRTDRDGSLPRRQKARRI